PRAHAAQRQPAPSREATTAPETSAPATSAFDAEELRQQLERLLDQYPPSLARVLRLDPTLLTNPSYLQPYPALATFIQQHPEVPHNPAYFLQRYEEKNNFYRHDPKDRIFKVWKYTLKENYSYI